MNTLILNRETFELPADGWYQIAPLGEFPHEGAGVVQVVDAVACEAMVAAFQAEAAKPNFAGLLIDFDHFSLDGKQKSEAAGWIVELGYRAPRDEGGSSSAKTTADKKLKPEMGTYNAADGVEPVPPATDRVEPVPPAANSGGLWGKIRWSDTGEDCVRGGRYRFLSPVWAKADCEDLGGGRLRPVRLLNAAVTNDPNIKGMVPLSNRGKAETLKTETLKDDAYNAARDSTTQPSPKATAGTAEGTENTDGEKIRNASPAPRFKWVLGVHDRHCPSCAALAGQVHTMAQWDAAGLRPGAPGLICQGHCHCKLVKTGESESGSLAAVAVRKDVMNRRSDEGGSTSAKATADKKLKPEMVNNWSDEARAAALAVRRAKAAERKKQLEEERKEAEGKGKGKHDGGIRILPIDDVEAPEIPVPEVPGEEPLPDDYEYWRHAMEGYSKDAEAIFRETYGHLPESPEEIREAEDLANIPDEYRTGGDTSPEDLAKKLFKKHKGLDDGMKIQPVPPRNLGDSDPAFGEAEREDQKKSAEEREQRREELDQMHETADELGAIERDGGELTAQEKAFLRRYKARYGDYTEGIDGLPNRADLVDFSRVVEKARRGSPVRNGKVRLEGTMADEVKVSVEELTNALRFEREKNAVLLDQVVVLEDELVNRSMTEFDDVVTEASRDFWKQQLLANREGALVALAELKSAKLALGQRETVPADGGGRQPLHNRGGKVRQGSPTGGESGRASVVDGVAVRIRNRAHELCKSEGVPFSVAFRRAEREIGEKS